MRIPAANQRRVRALFGKTAFVTAYACSGCVTFVGDKHSRGCLYRWHLQPCPGGPIVWSIKRPTTFGFQQILGQGESLTAAIDAAKRYRV